MALLCLQAYVVGALITVGYFWAARHFRLPVCADCKHRHRLGADPLFAGPPFTLGALFLISAGVAILWPLTLINVWESHNLLDKAVIAGLKERERKRP